MMIAVRPKSKSVWKLGRDPNAWEVILRIEGKSIPPNIPLTTRSINHWLKEHDDATKYVSLKSLTGIDVISIISASKRQEVSLSIDRWGRLAFYKIKVPL